MGSHFVRSLRSESSRFVVLSIEGGLIGQGEMELRRGITSRIVESIGW